MKWLATAALAVLAAAPATAQRTWTVNPNPGLADFTDLPPAFAAASPGDTIIVQFNTRPPYTSVTTSKGVRVFAVIGWYNEASFRVVDLPADETFEIAGFVGRFDLEFVRCAGRVHIDNVRSLTPLGNEPRRSLIIEDCRLVTCNRGVFTDVRIANSTALLTEVDMYGWAEPWLRGTQGWPGLRTTDSEVRLVDCGISGPRVYPTGPYPDVPAIEMNGGSLRVSGRSSSTSVHAGEIRFSNPSSLSVGPAISSNGGLVVLDPDVPLNNNTYFPTTTGTSQFVSEQLPFMRLWHVPPAPWDMFPELYAEPGASAYICVSLAADPLPTFLGELWLDTTPGGIHLLATGTVDATGLFTVSTTLNHLIPMGMVTTWQGIVVDQRGIRLTLPVVPVRGYG